MKGENNEYHIRIEGGVNYEQKVKDYAAQMGDGQKDEYFYMFLSEVLPVEGETYRRNFRIWEHHIEWQSHKCSRTGYIFMGNPNERSTTQPQQHFYIFFMPIFDTSNSSRPAEKDSVYFLMNDLNEELKQKLQGFENAAEEARRDEIKALLDAAENDERIRPADRPTYQALLEKDFENTCKVLKGLQGKKLITDTLTDPEPKNHKGAWDEEQERIRNKRYGRQK